MNEPITFLSCWPDFLTGQRENPVRVLMVDNDAYLHRKVIEEFSTDMRIKIVGEAEDIQNGRRLLSGCKFDVLIVDLMLEDGNGFDLIQEAKRNHGSCEVIVVSSAEDEFQVVRAFELGATGFLIKNAPFQSYSESVLQVVNGGAAITPRLARRLFSRMSGGTPVRTAPVYFEGVGIGLSARETEVLRLIAAGILNVEIASRLFISSQTVSAHIKNIYKKLDVHSRAHAVGFATSRGII